MSPLHYIYFLLLYTTIISFISQYRQLNSIFNALLLYLIILAVFNSVGMFLRMQFHVKNNLFLYHILTPVEYLLLALMYYRSFKSILIKKAIRWTMYGFTAACILLTLFVEPADVIDSYARTIEAILITIWIVIYFYQTLSTPKIMNLQSDPLFWINVGFLIYFIGNLFIKGLLNTLITTDKEMAKTFYKYGYFLEFLLFIQINIALYCRKIFRFSKA